MKEHFAGYYYKHQKDDITLCLIVGQADSGKFIQVITDDFSQTVPFTTGNVFSSSGIELNIQTPQLSLSGKIKYRDLTPIQYDIMGPFAFFPMECRHEIVSMRHRLEGTVLLNGSKIDFTGGMGYVEGDSGCSFPSSYTWIQANDFSIPCSIMAAVAEIPFCSLHFQGCICILWYRGREYRLATYLGARAVVCTEEKMVIRQGRYRLEIRVKSGNSRKLDAPQKGRMTRTVAESASCPAEFRFFIKNKPVLRLKSHHASFEQDKK